MNKAAGYALIIAGLLLALFGGLLFILVALSFLIGASNSGVSTLLLLVTGARFIGSVVYMGLGALMVWSGLARLGVPFAAAPPRHKGWGYGKIGFGAVVILVGVTMGVRGVITTIADRGGDPYVFAEIMGSMVTVMIFVLAGVKVISIGRGDLAAINAHRSSDQPAAAQVITTPEA